MHGALRGLSAAAPGTAALLNPRCFPCLSLSHSARQVNSPGVLPRLRSLTSWLAQHAAGKASSLRLRLDPPCAPAPAAAHGACDGGAAAAQAALAAALQACGEHGRLDSLELSTEFFPIHAASGWAAGALAHLRSLRLSAFEGGLLVAAPLQACTALAELALEGAPLQLAPDAGLPPALTKLHLGGAPADVVAKASREGGHGWTA